MKSLAALLFALSCSLASTLTHAATESDFPKRAVITMRGYWGFMPVGSAVHTWTMSKQQYHLENRMSGLGFTLRYVSDGVVDDGVLKPVYYAEFRGKDKSPRSESHFDWQKKTVSVGKPGEQSSEPMLSPVQDLNALAFDLAWRMGKPTSYEQLSNGRKLKKGAFVQEGEQTIKVGGESVRVVYLISRLPKAETVELWLAPSLNYLPLRIKFKGSEKIEMQAQKVEIDGKVVLGN